MEQKATVNRRIVLAARPHGLPRAENFRLEESPIPQPDDGQILLRTIYLSLDPYMRNVMNEVPPVYAPSVALNQTMVGGTVSRVVTSRNSKFQVGDWVLANAGWQDYAVTDGNDCTPLTATARPSLALGVHGMPGFTAYVGLFDIGQPKPGDTVVVAAAAGAVGSVVGQLAKLKGARVVGIAGGPEKCRHVADELGFDGCIDHRSARFADELAAACPKGIDVYFENVGGHVLDAVVPLLNIGARIPVIGTIAHYNDDETSPGPNKLPRLLSTVLQKRIRMQGMVILDHYGERFDTFRREMGGWLASGRVKAFEDVVEGLENAPQAFIGLLQGRNVGKLVVRVARD